MTMFKSDVQSVRLSRGYAVATGRLLCLLIKAAPFCESVVLSNGQRHVWQQYLALAKCRTDRVFNRIEIRLCLVASTAAR